MTIQIFSTKNKIVTFCFSYIGLFCGLYVFRKAFKILDYLYIFCMLVLAARALKCSITKPLSDWTFIVKPYLLIVSLLFSIELKDFSFMLKNLSAIMSMLLMGVIFLKKTNKTEITSFISAFKICLLLNYIFATLQLIILIVFKINIFMYLGYYLKIYDSLDSQNLVTGIRITGLIWDPFVLGMFCALGFFLFDYKLIKLWCLILLYYSSSRAGQLGLFIAVLFYYTPKLKKYLKRDYLALPIVILSLGIIVLEIPTIIDVFDLNRGFDRNSVGWRRVEYITKIPEVWEEDNIFFVLFGGAPFYNGARYILSTVPSIAKETGGNNLFWVVESDWFGILIGRGIIGFVFYILLYLKILISNTSILNKSLALAILFGGVGYYYDTAIFACFIVYFAGNSSYDINFNINPYKKRNQKIKRIFCKIS